MGLLRKIGIIVVLFIALIIGLYYWIRMPGPNGLGFLTTAKEAVIQGHKLAGKNILITGGHSGIGITTVEALAIYKPNIWILVRKANNGMERCLQFAAEVQVQSGNTGIYCEEIDLAEMDSVVEFVKRWKILNLPVHLLILNAGIPPAPYTETKDGFQLIWQTNHLGHFLLTNLLLENLKMGKPCRVVVVSSEAYIYSDIHWDDISGKSTWYRRDSWTSLYDEGVAYGQSKTANILFANHLNEVLSGYGVANSLYPGIINTQMLHNASGIIHLIWAIYFKTPEQGAATTVYVATNPEYEKIGGEFFGDCNIAKRSYWAADKVSGQRLWDMSIEMVKKWLPKKSMEMK
jgi:NAD(P)-dependent dehydrogenase (short-subunit alcohol dehydrogenase family)